ncbi:sodium channel protein Nach-like [Galleria mellonella]|uniref:Sodium channel protein Nach-like n=1 Tax=Galleria mellonella TaxID=7137 RepID=A0ABM3MQA4_GALME|nr:sodium channel protein Nach-like [Galleria mellonella]
MYINTHFWTVIKVGYLSARIAFYILVSTNMNKNFKSSKMLRNSNFRGFKNRYEKERPAPTKFQIFKQSLKTIAKEYCTESSICGLKHIVDDKTPSIERVIWIIMLIGALVCSISLIWETFDKYNRAPLVTTQMPEGIPVNSIIFPAIGICTTNRISKRAVDALAKELLKAERNKKYNEQTMLTLLYGLGQLYDLQPVNENIVSSMRLHLALGDYDVHELIKNLTPSCEDLLIRCAWNDDPKNCSELFDFRLTMNGYCCTFNYLRQSDSEFEDVNGTARSIDMYKYGNKSSFDFDQGLKILMRINENDDFFRNMPLQGAQLQFSDAYDFPDAPSGSFGMQIIRPNVQMTVMVIPTYTTASSDIRHVPVRLRGCLFYDESSYLPFYTHSDCMLKCRVLFLLSKCNCIPFNMLKMANTRTCDLRDVACLRRYYAQSITIRPEIEPLPPELELELVEGGISCPMCFPTCSKTTYNYDFINVNIYPENLNTAPNSERDTWLLGANFTGTSIVHVKYARETVDFFRQSVIMKWFDLFSDMGSTCGFVTGFSFVSVLEFLYFFVIKLIREINATRKRNRIANTLQTNTPYIVNSEFEPIGRYRAIYWNELTAVTHAHQM